MVALVPEIITVPSVVVPCMNVTMPLGVLHSRAPRPTPWPPRRHTDWPTTTVVGLNVRAIDVESGLTVKADAVDVVSRLAGVSGVDCRGLEWLPVLV